MQERNDEIKYRRPSETRTAANGFLIEYRLWGITIIVSKNNAEWVVFDIVLFLKQKQTKTRMMEDKIR